MATTKITNPDLFELESLNTALRLPSGSTEQRPANPSTGEWRYNTTTNLVEYYDGGSWRELVSEDIPPIPSENFNTITYTGDGANPRSITGVGFKPDLLWIKKRNSSDDNVWFDTSRGPQKEIISNSTAAEATKAGDAIISFDSDGFTTGNNGAINANGDTYVAWCFKANGGTTTSNSDGTITSTVQVNSKAKFSVVQYTANAVSGATIGHGLGVEPDLVIVKNLNLSTQSWNTYVKGITTTNAQFLTLNTNAANGNTANPRFIPGNFSSSVFSVGNDNSTNGVSGVDTYVAYCFASVANYSSIGSYTGNASQDGPLVETGFEPALLIVKKITSTANWRMVDNKRNPLNHRQRVLFPNLSNAEDNSTGDAVDFLSTGFKISNDDNSWNQNAEEFLYIAFASDPTAAPTLADSFANKLYTGNATSDRAITGLGFSPSWVWIKNRTVARDHMVFDNVRLLGSELVPGNYTNLDAADFNTTANDFNSFDSDGFTVGSGVYTNESGQDMVAWCWKASPIPAINNDGDIQSIVSANQAAGFSIVRYAGNSTAGATVGHGLTSAPDAVIIKCMTTGSTNWINYYEPLGNSEYLTLNLSNGVATSTNWFYSNATTFTLNQTFGNANTTGRTYVAYCFKSTSGFSKIGSYTGNGSTQSITGVGFQPSWLMIKQSNSSNSWRMFDSARGLSAPQTLFANLSNAQDSESNTVSSFDSDGWTMGSQQGVNDNGDSYIYMAFKENPAQPVIPSGYMEYLVVAGGGGSSADSGGGAGAGAGGLRTSYGNVSGGGSSAETAITLATGTYTVTVGAGGAAYDGATTSQNGVASTITGTASVSTVGGGAAGDFLKSGTAYKGNDGGSGGGSANSNGALSLSGGAGTANEGFAGGAGSTAGGPGSDSLAAGGGGGAAQVGSDGALGAGGNGGNGLNIAITGSYVGYAGGGGGGCRGASGTTAGQGGTGGGGNAVSSGVGNAGTANTGGGGGGGRSAGANGGSGVVILRMNTSDYSGTTSGSPVVTTSGSETILKYLASGSYTHNPSTAAGKMNYMVLAGGASGASNGGGGGAGGLRSSWYASGGGAAGETPITLSSGTYTITIGGGGALVDNTTGYQDPGNDGSATTISGNATVNTVGGGGGGSNNINAGRTGGAGGGAGASPGTPYNGGSGTAGEGFDGGRAGAVGHPYSGAGGGGTGAVGGDNSGSGPGAGGDGVSISITGTGVNYGGGGGGTGGTSSGSYNGGAGGTGGGGAGGAWNGNGVSGTANTGGGGGGSGDAGSYTSGAGGSGLVILRLQTAEYSGTTTGSPTVTTVGTETILTFTGSGTYVHS